MLECIDHEQQQVQVRKRDKACRRELCPIPWKMVALSSRVVRLASTLNREDGSIEILAGSKEALNGSPDLVSPIQGLPCIAPTADLRFVLFKHSSPWWTKPFELDRQCLGHLLTCSDTRENLYYPF